MTSRRAGSELHRSRALMQAGVRLSTFGQQVLRRRVPAHRQVAATALASVSLALDLAETGRNRPAAFLRDTAAATAWAALCDDSNQDARIGVASTVPGAYIASLDGPGAAARHLLATFGPTVAVRKLRGHDLRLGQVAWPASVTIIFLALGASDRLRARHRPSDAVLNSVAERRAAYLRGQHTIAVEVDSIVDRLQRAAALVDGTSQHGVTRQLVSEWKRHLAEETRDDAAYLADVVHSWQRRRNLEPDLRRAVATSMPPEAATVVLSRAEAAAVDAALDQLGGGSVLVAGRVVNGFAQVEIARTAVRFERELRKVEIPRWVPGVLSFIATMSNSSAALANVPASRLIGPATAGALGSAAITESIQTNDDPPPWAVPVLFASTAFTVETLLRRGRYDRSSRRQSGMPWLVTMHLHQVALGMYWHRISVPSRLIAGLGTTAIACNAVNASGHSVARHRDLPAEIMALIGSTFLGAGFNMALHTERDRMLADPPDAQQLIAEESRGRQSVLTFARSSLERIEAEAALAEQDDEQIIEARRRLVVLWSQLALLEDHGQG
jgi:hypothetical protein